MELRFAVDIRREHVPAKGFGGVFAVAIRTGQITVGAQAEAAREHVEPPQRERDQEAQRHGGSADDFTEPGNHGIMEGIFGGGRNGEETKGP